MSKLALPPSPVGHPVEPGFTANTRTLAANSFTSYFASTEFSPPGTVFGVLSAFGVQHVDEPLGAGVQQSDAEGFPVAGVQHADEPAGAGVQQAAVSAADGAGGAQHPPCPSACE